MALTKNILRVHLVNGDVRAVKYQDEDDCIAIINSLLVRLGANVEVAVPFFGLLMANATTQENYWLTPGTPVADFIRKYLRLPLDDWKFILKLRILPKSPQHLSSKDTFSYLYLYEQVLHQYLEDQDLRVDNDTAIKLGCLELRRFYRDLPQIALSRPENFKILEKEIGLQKFFRKSLLQSMKVKALRKQVLQFFKEYESLTDEVCVDRFFLLIAKFMSYDVEEFKPCAVEETGPLNCVITIGPNCDVEVQRQSGERKLIALFNDITEFSYQADIGQRGKLSVMTHLADHPLVIRTFHLTDAMNMATLLDGYCKAATTSKHSRLRNPSFSTITACDRRSSPLPPIPVDEELRPPMPLPSGHPSYPTSIPGSILLPAQRDSSHSYGVLSSCYSTVGGSEFNDDYAEVSEKEFASKESMWYVSFDVIVLGDRIGEGQFGDVHKGVMTTKEGPKEVAVKSCKMAGTSEEKMKFMREAAVMKEFSHPNIVQLFGWTMKDHDYFILMELAPYGELRNYLITNSGTLTQFSLLMYVAQLGSAMAYLESKNYVHRDIAARNLLVVSPNNVKLGDFGLSRWLNEGSYYIASRGKLPIKWMAPESIYYRRFTTASDVWMFGVCAWEIMMKGVKPFMGIKNQHVTDRIENGERLPLPNCCPPRLFHMMMKCWSYDPMDRPSFRDIDQKLREIVDEEEACSHLPTPQLPPRLHLTNGNGGPDMQCLQTMCKFGSGSSSDTDEEPGRRRSRSPMATRQELSSSSTVRSSSEDTQTPVSPMHKKTVRPTMTELQLQNRPLPPPPPSDITSPVFSEPTYSPILKNLDQGPSSPEMLMEPVKDAGYAYVRVRDGSGIPDDFDFRKLPTPPPDDDDSEDGEAPVEDAPQEPFRDEELYLATMKTVRSVVAMSGGVEAQPIAEYVGLIKEVGLSLRELVGRVSTIKECLPKSEHEEQIQMAEKMVQADMGRLIQSMKDCQKYQHMTVIEDYKKKLLQNGHCLAQNAKSLFEVVTLAQTELR